MSAGFATSSAVRTPSNIVFGDLSADLPILSCGSAPADANTLIMMIGVRDTDAWSISSITVGGQAAAAIYTASASPIGGSNQIQMIAWGSAEVAAMTSTGTGYDDVGFIAPAALTYFWLRNADLSAVKIYSQGSASVANNASVSVSMDAGDLLVAFANNSDNAGQFAWAGDVSVTSADQDNNGASLLIAVAYTSTEQNGELRVSTTSNANLQLMAAVFPSLAAAAPTITSVDDTTYTNGQTPITITGTGFGATQGSGGVTIWQSPDFSAAGGFAQQTIVSWADTSIRFQAVRAHLTADTTYYLAVSASDGTRIATASAVSVSFVSQPATLGGISVDSKTTDTFDVIVSAGLYGPTSATPGIGSSNIYLVATHSGYPSTDVTPTASQIIAGLDYQSATAPAAANTVIVCATTSVGKTVALGGNLSLPLYDIYAVAVNRDGTSSVESAILQLLSAPAGKQYVHTDLVHITGATQTNPVKVSTSAPHGFSDGQQCRIWAVKGMTELNGGGDTTADDGLLYYSTSASTSTVLILKGIDGTGYTAYTSGGFITPGLSVLESASADPQDWDTIVVDATTSALSASTSGGNYPITMNGDGTFIISASGDTERQTFDVALYYKPQTSISSAVKIYVNNNAPALTSGPFPSQEWQVSVSIVPVTAPAYIGDPELDAVTWSLTSAPSGITIDSSSGIIDGIPDSADAASLTVVATDALGDSASFPVSYVVLESLVMPDVDDGDVSESSAISAITSVDPFANITVTVVYAANSSVNPGFVYAQDPSAGTILSAESATIIYVAASLDAEFTVAVKMFINDDPDQRVAKLSDVTAKGTIVLPDILRKVTARND